MDFQYIIDEKGRKSSVIVPIKEWERRERLLESKKDKPVRKREPRLLRELAEAVEEMNLIKAGKKKARTLEELLDEL